MHLNARPKTKLGHGTVSPTQIIELPTKSILPAPENELLYRALSETDPDIIALAESLQKFGVQEPLVITRDHYLLSGHRRHLAALLAGLENVPCRVESLERADPGFIDLLREFNRQRIKTPAEITREEVISANPEEAHRLLLEHRRAQAKIDDADAIAITGTKYRARITAAKKPFLDAIIAILEDRRIYWPLSVRQVHYVLLNEPPLIHASKPHSRYRNDQTSYKAAIDLIARARLTGDIAWLAIDDETRPITTWKVYSSIAPFARVQLDYFLKDYYRDLQESQPNHIEIVGEKNTIATILRPVAMQYCIPMTIGRGYASLAPRYKMAQRYKRSGKEKLVLLIVSDFDPEGEDIPHSFARSMRDDFGIDNVTAFKVALTHVQIAGLDLHPNNLEKKKRGSRYKQFVDRYGGYGYELEAVKPDLLQNLLQSAVDRVIDVAAFNAALETEKKEAAYLATVRKKVQRQLSGLNWQCA